MQTQRRLEALARLIENAQTEVTRPNRRLADLWLGVARPLASCVSASRPCSRG